MTSCEAHAKFNWPREVFYCQHSDCSGVVGGGETSQLSLSIWMEASFGKKCPCSFLWRWHAQHWSFQHFTLLRLALSFPTCASSPRGMKNYSLWPVSESRWPIVPNPWWSILPPWAPPGLPVTPSLPHQPSHLFLLLTHSHPEIFRPPCSPAHSVGCHPSLCSSLQGSCRCGGTRLLARR